MNGIKESKNVLVSGGAKGIGRCLVRAFLERNYDVFTFDIDEEELKHTVLVHLKQYDRTRLGWAICNLRDISDIRAKVKQAAEFFNGKIDVLINNGDFKDTAKAYELTGAGIASPYWKDGKTMEDPDVLEQWQAYVETNLTAAFAVSAACIPYMKTSNLEEAEHVTSAGPCIIHMGSFRALQSDPNQEGYAATKAGQLGLMHSMAVTCQQWGIRVNLIAPGRIKVAHECKEGDENGTKFEETLTEEDIEHHPTNRAGRPGDIFAAVEYLVKSGFVTGLDMTIDGGVTRRKN